MEVIRSGSLGWDHPRAGGSPTQFRALGLVLLVPLLLVLPGLREDAH